MKVTILGKCFKWPKKEKKKIRANKNTSENLYKIVEKHYK